MPAKLSAGDLRSIAPVILNPVTFSKVILGARLWSLQRQILWSIASHPMTAVKACHSSGKTFLAAVAVLWFLVRYEDAIVITTAPVWSQVKRLLWKEIHQFIAQAKERGFAFPEANTADLQLDNKNYAIGISTNEGVRFQGFHAKHMLIVVDEAPGVRPDIFEAIEGIRAGGDVRLLLLGNPTVPSGNFFQAFEKERRFWNTFSISAFDTPNFLEPVDLADPEGPVRRLTLQDLLDLPDHRLDYNPLPWLTRRRWVRDAWYRWGPQSPLWQARVLGRFPKQAPDSLLWLTWLEQAQETEAFDYGLMLNGGIDVAGPGDAETSLHILDEAGAIVFHQAWSQPDPQGEVLNALAPFRSRLNWVQVDATGIGYYFYLRLLEEGIPAIPVNVGVPASDPLPGDKQLFVNLKAELLWKVRQRFQAGDFAGLADDDTVTQLASLRYRINSRGLVEIEPKERMLRRGVPSPDRAESFMLAAVSAPPTGIGHVSQAISVSGWMPK